VLATPRESVGRIGITDERRRESCLPAILIIAAVWQASCGGSVSPAAVASTPTPHVLTGQGTTWQVVATADGEVSGLALDGHGHMYAVQDTKNQIVEFSLQGAVVRRWGTQGSAPGQLNQPVRVVLDGQGDVYVTDSLNNRIQKFSPTGDPLAQWGGSGSAAGDFNFPIGIAIDGQGNVYVGDVRHYRVVKISPDGTRLTSWGSHGTQPGHFDGYPSSIALDANGNVFVSEAYGSDLIHEFSPSGVFIARWGGSGSDPGKFSEPRGLAFDREGDVYVGDTSNNRVQKLTPTGQFIAQWLGPSSAPFPEPSSITMDQQGYLYVSDGPLILRTCVASGGCG
jgi:tripartite motif-containing protein 71